MAKDAGKDLAHDVIKSDVPARSNAPITQEEAERLLQRFAELGELGIAKGERELRDQIIRNWQQWGGLTRPEQHTMFAESEDDRHTLNDAAQKKRQQAGLLDATRSFEFGTTKFFAGDHLRFEADIKSCRIAAGAKARLVDVCGEKIQIELLDSNELVTVPSHLVCANLAYALPSGDMTVTMPKSAHVFVSDRCTRAELSHVYYSLHRERCRLYLTEATAGESIRASVANATPINTAYETSRRAELTPSQPVRKRVIRHG
jgi:hypothetical protein